MQIIRTAEEIANALASSLDPTLRERLAAHRDYLLDYPGFALEELGEFLIVQPDDTLESINAACSAHLVKDDDFAFDAEGLDVYGHWLELLFVVSDDGFGVVLFVPLAQEADPALLSACQALAPSMNLPIAQ